MDFKSILATVWNEAMSYKKMSRVQTHTQWFESDAGQKCHYVPSPSSEARL